MGFNIPCGISSINSMITAVLNRVVFTFLYLFFISLYIYNIYYIVRISFSRFQVSSHRGVQSRRLDVDTVTLKQHMSEHHMWGSGPLEVMFFIFPAQKGTWTSQNPAPWDRNWLCIKAFEGFKQLSNNRQLPRLFDRWANLGNRSVWVSNLRSAVCLFLVVSLRGLKFQTRLGDSGKHYFWNHQLVLIFRYVKSS